MLLSILFVLTAKLNAQFARFGHLNVEDGLSQNSVLCITQDKQGFMWIGTYNGLNKYDGYKITIFKADPKDSNSISHNSVRCLYADNENNLWGGTIGGGMFKIDLSTGKVKKFYFDSTNANCLSNDYINSIKEYEPGKLFIATNDGLNIYEKATGRFTVYRKIGKNNLPLLSDNIKHMTMDTRGHIWFGHLNAGITDYDLKTGQSKFYSANISERKLLSNNIKAIFADSRGKIWVSCWNHGVNVIDTKTGRIYSSEDTTHVMKELNKLSLISQFHEDKEGNIWSATAEHGIASYNIKTNTIDFFENNKDDSETISGNTVFNIMQDNSGLLWAGTWQGGLSTLNLRTLKFGYFKHESNAKTTLADNNVSAFAKKSKNEVYIGHNAAADIFNTKTKEFKRFPGIDNNDYSLRKNSMVLYIYPDEKDSSIWFSTAGGHPYRYFPKNNSYKNYTHKEEDVNSFGHHTSYTILRDNNSRLWIGSTSKGLFLYNDEKDNFYNIISDENDETSLVNNSINTILKTSNGKFWIGTENGLCLFDPVTKKAKRYVTNKQGQQLFPDNGIFSLCIESDTKLWVGTTVGLFLLDVTNQTAKGFSALHKVFDGVMYGLQKDNSGKLWMATDNGLVRFNYTDSTFKIFTTHDGVQGREFSVNASFKADDGELFFGGLNGFNAFYPEKIETNTTTPKVNITGFTVLNKPYALPMDITSISEITLSYKDYFFAFEFACMDFTNPAKNKYEYQLEGFNPTWIDIGNEHQVTFTNLDPGTYKLLVRACNNDGVWCKEPAALTIIITPPFWRTMWFYTLCVVVIILIVYSYIKWREKKLIKEKSILENKVEERTLELKEEKQKVELAHKDIKDSINYAKRIQEAILPLKESISAQLKNYFILYKPKDIVAGDFYWFHALPKEHSVLIAAIDCTGHGVPGAFMSMIGNEQLSKIINEKQIYQPDLILNELHTGIRAALKQDQMHGETRDGMDVALCKIDLKKKHIEYAGAMRPLWLIRNGELIEMKADKQPIGGLDADYRKPFTNNKIELQSNDTLYIFTDGFADQFGGPKGKKFMLKNFEKLLLEINTEPMPQQETILNERIENWKGEHEQVDDILVIGIHI